MTEDSKGRPTCWWHSDIPDYQAYHDEEWGRPVDNDRRLFEKLCLEGFQAGLSWLTILRKRDAFRNAFLGFDVDKLLQFTDADIDRLCTDSGIVRHRGKIASVVNNVRRAQELSREFGSLATYFWAFEPDTDSRPSQIDREALMRLATPPESVALSKDLKQRGWSFVGPTTVYAFMQAMGLVNDHIEGCWCRGEVEVARAAFVRPSRSD